MFFPQQGILIFAPRENLLPLHDLPEYLSHLALLSDFRWSFGLDLATDILCSFF